MGPGNERNCTPFMEKVAMKTDEDAIAANALNYHAPALLESALICSACEVRVHANLVQRHRHCPRSDEGMVLCT